MIYKRTALLVLITLTGLAVETSVLGSLTLAGARPDLLLVATVAFAMSEGPAFGAIAGFTMGLSTDLFLNGPEGLTALAFMLAGYAVGRIRMQLQTPSAWLPMAMVFVATAVVELFSGALRALVGSGVIGWALPKDAALAAVYNAVLTPFVFPLLRMLAAKLRPSKVVAG